MSAGPRGPLFASRDGVALLVRATPKSAKDAILGLVVRGDETRLAVKIRAAPHDGAANDAILALIAKAFACKASSVSIAAGAKDRDKTVHISGVRLEAVAAWLNRMGRHGETD